jgi:DNA replication protein
MKKETMVAWINEGNLSIPQGLFRYYTQIGLNEEECMVLLQVNAFIEQGNPFPTPEQLSARMTLSAQTCTTLLRSLVKKGAITINEHEDIESHLYSESYSLDPLWEKLLELYGAEKEAKGTTQSDENLYTTFEKEFGRPLSPIECESLAMWIDQDGYEPLLIKAALRESVISGKLNFRYIDRILFEWNKNGVKTVEQAKTYGQKFRRYQQQPRSGEENKKRKKSSFPFYNWLEK